jgi:hypothetical protein
VEPSLGSTLAGRPNCDHHSLVTVLDVTIILRTLAGVPMECSKSVTPIS